MKKNQIAIAFTCALIQLCHCSYASEATEGFGKCTNSKSENCFTNITGTIDHLEGNIHRTVTEGGDPEGLHMDVSLGSESLEVTGDTHLTVVGDKNNAYGIRLSGSRSNTLQTTFHDTQLEVASNGSHGHAAKSNLFRGGFQSFRVLHERVPQNGIIQQNFWHSRKKSIHKCPI